MDIVAGGSAVIYARYSCSKQREASIEDQLRVCHDWCDRSGFSVVAEYCDHAISGRSDDRPEFRRMLGNAGESDIVLVYMMDRFSRDQYDAPVWKRELSKKGVKVVSATEAIPETPEGIIMEKLLEGMAAYESAVTAERVKRGMEGNARKCMANGMRCYGYRTGEDGRYVIEESEAAFVREAFRRRCDGEQAGDIARDFARRGVRSSTGRPCPRSMIHQMIHCEKYRGLYKWGDIRVEGGVPRIVSDETWALAQNARVKKVRKEEDWGDFALSGHVECARCGSNMPGTSGISHTGRKYEYYTCKRCDMKAVRRDWLEGSVVDALRTILADDTEALRIAELVCASHNANAFKDLKRQAEASLASAEKGLRNLLDCMEQGIVAPGMKDRIALLQAQRDRALKDIERYNGVDIDPKDFARFLQRAPQLTDKLLLQAFVRKVVVFEEDVWVVLNYRSEKNEPTTLELSRVRTELKWWTVSHDGQTKIAALNGWVYVSFPRAA